MVNGNFSLGPMSEVGFEDLGAISGDKLRSPKYWLEEQKKIITNIDFATRQQQTAEQEMEGEEETVARTIREVTNAIRDLLGQEAQRVFSLETQVGMAKANSTLQQGMRNSSAVITQPEAADPMDWGNDETIKLLSEMTKEVMNKLPARSAEDTVETQEWVTYELMKNFADPNRRLDDDKFVTGTNQYQNLNYPTQIVNGTIATFEKLTERTSDPKELFKSKRIELIRKKMLATELISEELNYALEYGATKRDGNDELVQMAWDTQQGLMQNEFAITSKALDESSMKLDSAYTGFFSAADVPAMLEGDFSTDNATLIPVPGASIRTAIEEENQRNRLNTFANNSNLTNAVDGVLGPVLVSSEDEDSIEKNTRDRLLNYLESLRTQIKTNQPGLSDQEIGAMLYTELISATMPDSEGPGGTSPIDRFRIKETQIVTDKKAKTASEAEAKKQRTALESEMKRLRGASKSDGLAKVKEYLANQFTLDTTISAEGLNTMAAEWYQQQQDALARGEYATPNSEIFGQFNASILGPGGFIDQGWADQAIDNPALMYETYTDPNDPSQQLNVSDAANRSGYQMAPNGRVGQAGTRWDPILNKEVGGATYIDPNTGQIAVDQFGNPILLKGKEILENAHLVDPLTLFNYYRTMDMSPGEIENMGMGGAPPAFPVQDFSAFLPDQGQLTKGDMYTTDAFGNKIPYYPYGDPSDPVPGRRAFPGYQGTDYERFEQFLPGYEAPDARYDQALKRKDTVLPTSDPFYSTGEESYFNLGPTEQGPIAPGAGTGTDLRIETGSPEEELF